MTRGRSQRSQFIRPAALSILLCGALYAAATSTVQHAPLEASVRAAQPSSSFNLTSSSNENLDNDDPRSVSGRGDELWVINSDRDRRFRYERSDGSGGASNSLPDDDQDNPAGMWV